MTDEIKEAKYELSPFQSHFYQAIYDLEGLDNDTEMDTKFNEIDFDALKVFCIFPRMGSPILTAILINYAPGHRLIYRRENYLSMVAQPNQDNGVTLVPAQQACSYILGLIEDDGSEEIKLIEKAEIGSLQSVDWSGGFRVVLPADGKLEAVGAYGVNQFEKDIDGRKIQFIEFTIRKDT
jgi:hypothetical protein